MALTVYQFAHSPYCIPITQVLTALGAPFEVRNVKNGNRAELILLTNGGSYQVPVLEHDGRVVFETGDDTQEIARYIDAEFAGGRLFPPTLEGLQGVLIPHIENEIEGVTFKLTDPHYLREVTDLVEHAMILRHKERKFGRGCEERWLAERGDLTARAAELLRPFDQMLAHGPWLLGAAPVYTDFLLYGILGNLTYKGYNELPVGQPHLADWAGRLREYRF